MIDHLMTGAAYLRMIRGGVANLQKHRMAVNDLNVFPIPDGDTGDNMLMTLESGLDAAGSASAESLSEVSGAVAKGVLLGARGNSGVILSRLFAGIARGFEGMTSADLPQIAAALENGVKEAYAAVPVPVEGTILTVAKDAVAAAKNKLTENSSVDSFAEDLVSEMCASLERTPELLDVLKEAGVVDSGGAGLVYITEGMQSAMHREVALEESSSSPKAPKVDLDSFTEDCVLEFGYCTEFLLRLQHAKCDLDSFDIEELIAYLNSQGNSVVAFRDGSIVKVHVHTMTPGVILNHCQKFGEYLTLKIENMSLQHNELTKVQPEAPAARELKLSVKPHKAYATVTVAAGSGIRSLFEEMGADMVVEGGQSMNPSVEDLVNAYRECSADTVLVFPNNSNIKMSAQQAAQLVEGCTIRVLPTKTIGEGYAALSMLDTSSGDTDRIVEELTEVIASTVSASVSRASRDAFQDGVTIHEGDILGFTEDKIHVSTPDLYTTLEELCDALDASAYDILLLLKGKDVSREDAEKHVQELQKKYRRTEVILMSGEQPIYDYLVVLQ